MFPNTKQYLRMAPRQISSGFVPLPHIGETGAAYYDSWIYQAIPRTLMYKSVATSSPISIFKRLKMTLDESGWPHSSPNEIPCVFPEFSLCYKIFLCYFYVKTNN